MLTRLVAIAASAFAFAGTVCAQGTGAATGTGHQRPDGNSTGAAKPRVPPAAPASAPTTGNAPLLPGAGIIVAPEDGGRPPRPEASPGTPANPSGLRKPD
ncbi:hypothetical protein [Burkholderia sp. WSM2232]|uniref:hypothetical protein n=1 Tax=Burkholderia sp. WSM2232 TaxID=944436 RepID=UPI000A03CB46|nr:hypothetical protein [Burkholderia sp. WSM2232]